MTPEFLLTTLIVVVTPGTGVLYTLAAGLSRGARASVIAAVGCTLGIVPHMLAAITGLAAVLHASALAFDVIKYVGVAYLIYMAWSMWRDTGALTVSEESAPQSAARVIVSGILINILNPKLTILLRIPAAVRQSRRSKWPSPDAGTQRRVHACHARRVRALRFVR
jgi:threonine/homoserine/homoserine lactone efflux protein